MTSPRSYTFVFALQGSGECKALCNAMFTPSRIPFLRKTLARIANQFVSCSGLSNITLTGSKKVSKECENDCSKREKACGPAVLHRILKRAARLLAYLVLHVCLHTSQVTYP